MSSLSTFDMFKIGIGPSSSHTVGPMRAAGRFVRSIEDSGNLERVAEVYCELYGSLGATGRGHDSDKAIILGLMGEEPETTDTDAAHDRVARVRRDTRIFLLGSHPVPFNDRKHLVMHNRKRLPYHTNGMRFSALDASGNPVHEAVFYSIGGGFVVDENAAAGSDPIRTDNTPLSHPFESGAELLSRCETSGLSISTLMLKNEKAWRDEQQIRSGLLNIWRVMQECVQNGCKNEGVLPGGLKVRRRASGLFRKLSVETHSNSAPHGTMDWVNLYALAVNEENAAGGRVVTAPTNGAAGIVPAVLHYYWNHCEGASEEGIVRFLLTAAAIGMLFKKNASISGAEVGCQGEVGSACSMAAAGLTEVLGGTPEQVENAAEIGIEHNLGLTCDPIGGLVQIPCIERNAMAAVKAINACRLALRGDGRHHVSLDKAIQTMRDTGRDMSTKYKETSRGGLALNVVEVPVNVVEC